MAGFNVLSNMSVWADASRQRTVDVPGFGSLSYANGVPSAVSAIRAQVPGPETRFDDHDREWLTVDRALVEQVLGWPGPEGELPVTVFASRHRALTTNSFQYAGLLTHHILFPIAQLAAEPDDSVATYVDQLSAPTSGPPTVLVTTSTNAGDFEPAVTQRFAEAAARRIGFRLARTMRLPDGRTIRLWRRQGS